MHESTNAQQKQWQLKLRYVWVAGWISSHVVHFTLSPKHCSRVNEVTFVRLDVECQRQLRKSHRDTKIPPVDRIICLPSQQTWKQAERKNWRTSSNSRRDSKLRCQKRCDINKGLEWDRRMRKYMKLPMNTKRDMIAAQNKMPCRRICFDFRAAIQLP